MHYFPNSIKEKKRFLENPQLTLGQQRIPYADPEIKYLETTLNSYKKLCKTSIQEIVYAAKCVKSLKLKSHQKINLLRIYLLSRYIHKLVTNPLPVGILDQIDQEIKKIIKEILHLHDERNNLYEQKS